MWNNRRILGLAITEQGISAVQIAVSPGRRVVQQTASLAFSDEVHLGEPERLGKELKKALGPAARSAARCIVGLPAIWIATREKNLPAADPESLRSALAMAVEREFASGGQDLMFDYTLALPSASGHGVNALVVAAPRRIVEQVLATAKSAGLSVSAITSSSAALVAASPAAAGGEASAPRVTLCLLPRSSEVVMQQSDGALRLIRHLPVRVEQGGAYASPQIDGLAGELARMLALAPAGPGGAATASGRELLIWDGVGIDRQELGRIGQRLGVQPRICDSVSELGLSSPAGPLAPAFAQAAALACSNGRAEGSPAIDFLHSRLAPPRTRRIGKPIVWAVAAALVLAAVGLYAVMDWRSRLDEVAMLRDKQAEVKEPTRQAREIVESVAFARTWYDRRPEFLGVLREVTAAFPDEGRIWATNLMIRQDGEGSEGSEGGGGGGGSQLMLTGKAVNEVSVLDVVDRLKANHRLSDVKPLFIRQSGGTTRDVSFAVSLTARGAN